MVTIERLAIQFDVEGEGQDRVFAEMFDRRIAEWSRHQKERREQDRNAAAARSLGHCPDGNY